MCCHRRGVSEACSNLLCDPTKPPNDFDVYNIFDHKINCLPHMKNIAECLADGRNHIYCCINDAKDRDENACFGLCAGEGLNNLERWDNYQTCLALNIATMYKCFERGYLNIPSPPTATRIISKDMTSAVFTWSPPESNPHLAYSYHVVCRESDNGVTEMTIDTRSTKVTLTGLRADSKYSVAVAAVSRDGIQRSLLSDILYFYTAGVAPRISAYKQHVSISRKSEFVTLACRMQIPGTMHTSAHIQWMKRNDKNGQYYILSGNRYSLTNYISSHGQPRLYVSTLHIQPLQISDFGTYRCIASNDFGTSSSNIQLSIRKVTFASPIPPELPYQCCQRQNIRSPCASICGTQAGKRGVLRAETFMNNQCDDEIGKFLSCTIAGIDEGECCLRNKVPNACLPLCDETLEAGNEIPFTCALHTFSIFECRMQNAEKRPKPVTGLKANSFGDTTLVSWNRVDTADIYYIYWKRKSAISWEMRSISNTDKRINGAEEIVVLASNDFGNSPASQLDFDGNRWVPLN